MEPSFRKLLQKKIYDIVSDKYGLLLVIVAVLLLVVSALHFGETVLEWSSEKYAAVFNSFSDNVAGKSFRDRLCLPVPIDVVYTWVNGSDPKLLRELRREKAVFEKELNISRDEACSFSNCLPAPMAVLKTDSGLALSLESVKTHLPQLVGVTRVFTTSPPDDYNLNLTIVVFETIQQVDEAMNESLVLNGRNITLRRTYYTTDQTLHLSLPLADTVLMTGFPHKISTPEDLKEKLPEPHRSAIAKVELDTDKGIAVLLVPDKKNLAAMTEAKNISIDGKNPTFIGACLIWDLRDASKDEDISASRFEDNEELRYSLRSIERFAPWVRHVYIVTNGQIPYWLQLDSSRVTVITHQDIFVNQSHLPTFSSPAIESHLHRIPGLSDKFIYLNDDVMFGKEVWPDDFYSYSAGQKVYLTWPVPNCNEGCPSTWIRDGYCDKACNNTDCDWDGGDCSGSNSHVVLGAGFHGGYSDYRSHVLMYCNTGCANSWVADKYCDQACNVRQCGFDAGDCGTDSYDKMPEVPFSLSKTSYQFPPGEWVGYFNLSNFMSGNISLDEALYSHGDIVRAVAVAQKFKVLTFVLQENYNKTDLYFTLKAHNEHTEEKIEFNFTLTVYPNGEKNKTEKIRLKLAAANETDVIEDDDVVVIEEIPLDKQQPKGQRMMDLSQLELPFNITSNLSKQGLDPQLQQQLSPLQQQFFSGELTYGGLRTKSFQIYQRFQHLALVDQAQARDVGRLGRHLSSLQQQQSLGSSRETGGMRNVPFLQMVKMRSLEENSMPWERRGTFFNLLQESRRQQRQREYDVTSLPGRHLMDTFGDSLRHVNRIYNKAFGFTSRKVPAHMPHMIDKHIMKELQEMFPLEWDVTSSHRVRHSQDMQYAFAYFYYLMGVYQNITAAQIFDQMDTDKSKTLSDREIRTLAARLYDLPLYLELLTGLEAVFRQCATNLTEEEQREVPPAELESYYEKDMPQVTRSLFLNCPNITDLLHKHLKPEGKYRYSIVDDSEVAFKMIRTNVSGVVGQLDDIRKNPKKFICLNDNIDHSKEEGKTVKAILQDFYESMFPMPSQFELPREYRNRFLHMDELREWRKYRDLLRFWTHLALILLVLFAVASFFADKIEALQRRCARHWRGGSNRGEEETKAPIPSESLVSV